jgi:hypothetical protein
MSEAIGTYECPICGFDKPHHHEPHIVKWHQTGHRFDSDGSDWGPLNANQRHSLASEAKSRYERQELHKAFRADPVAIIRSGGAGWPHISQRDWLFLLQELIIEELIRLRARSDP